MPSTSICARAGRQIARELGDGLADGEFGAHLEAVTLCASERASSSLRMGAARPVACDAFGHDAEIHGFGATRGAAGWPTPPAWRGARPRRSSGCRRASGSAHCAAAPAPRRRHAAAAIRPWPRPCRRRQWPRRPRTAPALPASPSMARKPTRVFMRVDRLSSSGSRASSSASASVGAQARKLDIGVGSTCRRRAPSATCVPGAQRQLAPLRLRARDFDARLGRAARA